MIFVGNFLLYGVLSPFISVLIRGYGYSHAVLGILLACCEAAAIASPFVMGHFADRWGRYRPVMLLSLGTSLVCGAVLFLSRSLPPRFAFLPFAVIPVLAFGYRALQPLSDAISTIKLGPGGNYGKYRALGSAAYFSMVVFLQLTPVWRPNTPSNIAFWVMTASAAAIVMTLFVPKSYFVNDSAAARPPREPEGAGRGQNGQNATIKHGTGRKLWSPLFVLGFSMIVLNRMAMVPVNSFMSLYVVEHMRWDAAGLMAALSSGAEIPLIFLSKRLIRRFHALPLMAAATAAILVRYLVILLFPTRLGVALSQLTHAACYGVFHPAAVAFISRCVPPERRALGMSLYLSLGTGLPTLLGTVAGGFVVDAYGFPALFAAFSVFAAAGVLLYLLTRRHTKRR